MVQHFHKRVLGEYSRIHQVRRYSQRQREQFRQHHRLHAPDDSEVARNNPREEERRGELGGKCEVSRCKCGTVAISSQSVLACELTWPTPSVSNSLAHSHIHSFRLPPGCFEQPSQGKRWEAITVGGKLLYAVGGIAVNVRTAACPIAIRAKVICLSNTNISSWNPRRRLLLVLNIQDAIQT